MADTPSHLSRAWDVCGNELVIMDERLLSLAEADGGQHIGCVTADVLSCAIRFLVSADLVSSGVLESFSNENSSPKENARARKCP